jgi:transcriptional regulator GlxA family with amidase domain
MSAGVDLALALLADDLGADLARVVAKILVVYHRRAGGQSQFSTLLDLDAQSDRVQTALTYAREHLNALLPVDALAKAACLDFF